jgi:hypothetical protein
MRLKAAVCYLAAPIATLPLGRGEMPVLVQTCAGVDFTPDDLLLIDERPRSARHHGWLTLGGLVCARGLAEPSRWLTAL